MNTEGAANTVVNYHTTVAPMLRGQPHKELKPHSLPKPVMHPGSPVGRELCVTPKPGCCGDWNDNGRQSLLRRLIVKNLFCPVTPDVLHQIRSKFGTVSNIFTFTKNNQF
ncbi:Polypyrimidine tract-binding protein 1 [Lemmus lemmus]